MDGWYASSIDPIASDRILFILNQTTRANRIVGKTLVEGPVFDVSAKGKHTCDIKKRSNCFLNPKNLKTSGYWN